MDDAVAGAFGGIGIAMIPGTTGGFDSGTRGIGAVPITFSDFTGGIGTATTGGVAAFAAAGFSGTNRGIGATAIGLVAVVFVGGVGGIGAGSVSFGSTGLDSLAFGAGGIVITPVGSFGAELVDVAGSFSGWAGGKKSGGFSSVTTGAAVSGTTLPGGRNSGTGLSVVLFVLGAAAGGTGTTSVSQITFSFFFEKSRNRGRSGSALWATRGPESLLVWKREQPPARVARTTLVRIEARTDFIR